MLKFDQVRTSATWSSAGMWNTMAEDQFGRLNDKVGWTNKILLC